MVGFQRRVGLAVKVVEAMEAVELEKEAPVVKCLAFLMLLASIPYLLLVQLEWKGRLEGCGYNWKGWEGYDYLEGCGYNWKGR